MWRHFDIKQKSKSFTLCNCVWSRWLRVIVWFTLTLIFLYLKLKSSHLLLWTEADFFLILCYHARHLQQIPLSKLLCGMYGLTAKSSIARLNICQILMRSPNIYLESFWYLTIHRRKQYLKMSEYKWKWKGKVVDETSLPVLQKLFFNHEQV